MVCKGDAMTDKNKNLAIRKPSEAIPSAVPVADQDSKLVIQDVSDAIYRFNVDQDAVSLAVLKKTSGSDISPQRKVKVDPNRIPVTKKKLKDKELLYLLRKMKPHLAQAIMTATNIMQMPTASDQNRLRSAALVLDTYRKLVLDVYDAEEEDDVLNPKDLPDDAPVVSFRIVE
jgi:hypothetical protein